MVASDCSGETWMLCLSRPWIQTCLFSVWTNTSSSSQQRPWAPTFYMRGNMLSVIPGLDLRCSQTKCLCVGPRLWICPPFTEGFRVNLITNSRIIVQGIAGRWSILFLWKVIWRRGPPFWKRAVSDVVLRRSDETEGLFAESVPSPAWQFSHSKDFWNVSGHAKFMLDHKRNPSRDREQH